MNTMQNKLSKQRTKFTLLYNLKSQKNMNNEIIYSIVYRSNRNL